MVFDPGEFLTRWTVRLAVACYLTRVGVEVSVTADRRSKRLGRWCWTAGCLLFLAHVVCAFTYFHNWSHRIAYEYTAEQTRESVGWDWGGGLYFNYLFTVLWTTDTIMWWCAAERHQRVPAGVFWPMHVFGAFMMFNATIVFGPPFWKWIGVVGAVGLLIRRLVQASRDRQRRTVKRVVE